MTTKKTQYQNGFTIVEMLVSLAVFSIVVTITIGSLLMLIASNRQLQVEQSIMTNLSFVLDGMTREIRTGKSYFCTGAPNYNANISGIGKIFKDDPSDSNTNLARIDGKTQDCPNGGFGPGQNLQGLAFKESGNSITGGNNSGYIMYFFDKTNTNDKSIKRKVGGGIAEKLQASDIEILDMQFFVVGSSPLSDGTDVIQPTVTIRLKVKEKGTGTEVYTIQTTITQRELDL